MQFSDNRDFRYEEPRKTDLMSNTRIMAGAALIIIGIIVSVFVLQYAFGIIEGEEPPGLVEQLIPAEEVDRTIQTETGAIILPESAFRLVAYIALAILIIACGSLATGMIRAGASVLGPNYADTLRKLKEQLRSK